MKLNQLRTLLEKQEKKEISIHSIIGKNGTTLIGNIVPEGTLKYETFEYTLTYTSPQNQVFQIVDISNIYQINYDDLTSRDNSDDNWSDNDDTNGDDNSNNIDKGTYPSDDIINADVNVEGGIIDGWINPYQLADGRLVYPVALGKLFASTFMDNNPGDYLDSDFPNSFYNAYYKLNKGLIEMKMNLPQSGTYRVEVRAGSKVTGSKFFSFILSTLASRLTKGCKDNSTCLLILLAILSIFKSVSLDIAFNLYSVSSLLVETLSARFSSTLSILSSVLSKRTSIFSTTKSNLDESVITFEDNFEILSVSSFVWE